MGKQQQSTHNEVPTNASWRGRAHELWQQANIHGVRVAIGTLLSLLFLWLAFRDIPISQIVTSFGQLDWRFMALALGLTLVISHGILSQLINYNELHGDISFYNGVKVDSESFGSHGFVQGITDGATQG